jgi:3-keto-5-aminohexanoate cleavage enzyme
MARRRIGENRTDDSSAVVITCAVSGAETTRDQNPDLPITPEEIAYAARGARDAGAAILHLHVRDEAGQPTQDPEVFRRAIELIRADSDIVIEVTTGGAVGMTLEERLAPLGLRGEARPDMASLDCGSVNFGDDYIINSLPMMRVAARGMSEAGVRPTLECFDLSHIDAARVLVEEGLVTPPLHFGLVLDVPGAVRYDAETLEFFVRRLPPGSLWTAVGIGKSSDAVISQALELGGFIRTGFEDNVYLERGVLAESNAQLVARAAAMAKAAGREPATPAEARDILGI